MERLFMDSLMPITNLYVCVNSVCLRRLCIFCFFSSVLWFIHLLQKRLGSVNAWTADLHLYLMGCSRLCSQTGRLGDFKLNSGKSPVMFCVVPPRIQWETSKQARQLRLVEHCAFPRRESSARDRDPRALLEKRARAESPVSRSAGQKQSQYRRPDQNQDQDQNQD